MNKLIKDESSLSNNNIILDKFYDLNDVNLENYFKFYDTNNNGIDKSNMRKMLSKLCPEHSETIIKDIYQFVV